MADTPVVTGLSRRTVLKGGVGIAIGMTAFGALGGKTFAQDQQVLKIIHPVLDMNWSPLRGGGPALDWFSLAWAAPMYFDDKNEIHPYVFTNWEHSEDWKTWTFKLDPKAVFSDGSKITPEDVKGTWEMAAMPLTKSGRIGLVLSGVQGYDDIVGGTATALSGVSIPDADTIVVALKAPDPIFYLRIANHLAPVTKVSQSRGADGNQVPDWYLPQNGAVYSGPFKFVEMDLDNGTYAWEPNENFFGPKPKLSRIEMRVIEDAPTATELLKRGEYQAHTALATPTVVKDLGADFVKGTPIPSGLHFFLNSKTAPFDDPKVREALMLALDRKEMLKASWPDGPYEEAEQILISVPGVDPDWVPYPYDPARAKQLLAESKYGGPENLPRIIFAGVIQPAQQAAAQFAVEQWRQNLGITAVELKPTLDNFAPSDVHIIRDDAGARVPDATEFLRSVIYSKSSVAQSKMNGYSNPEVDALLDQAAPLAADDPQRDDLARQAQRKFREDYQIIPWYKKIRPRWALANIAGMERNLDWQVFAPWNIEIT